jgi:predicted GNAT family acetyltransferase
MEARVVDNRDAERYEVWAEGELAGFTDYRLRPRRITLLHTAVLPGHAGEGLGSRLAREAIADARARGLALVPLCPFIAGYLRAHPELLESVVPSLRRRLAAAEPS